LEPARRGPKKTKAVHDAKRFATATEVESGIMLTGTSNFRYARYHCGDGVPALLDYGFLAAVARAQLWAHVDALGLP